MYCGKCGKELTGKEKFCPRCGSPIPGAGVNTIHKKKRYKARKIFIGVVCILIMAGVGTAIYQSSNDETSRSSAGDVNLEEGVRVALDTSYNIWAWGDGFGTTPEIIIENTDFIAE